MTRMDVELPLAIEQALGAHHPHASRNRGLGAVKATSVFGLLATSLVVTVSTGCDAEIKEQDVVPQVDAYTMIRLKAVGASGRGNVEVETLMTRSIRGWDVEPKAANTLRSKATTLCTGGQE